VQVHRENVPLKGIRCCSTTSEKVTVALPGVELLPDETPEEADVSLGLAPDLHGLGGVDGGGGKAIFSPSPTTGGSTCFDLPIFLKIPAVDRKLPQEVLEVDGLALSTPVGNATGTMWADGKSDIDPQFDPSRGEPSSINGSTFTDILERDKVFNSNDLSHSTRRHFSCSRSNSASMESCDNNGDTFVVDVADGVATTATTSSLVI
jgi:hypothetical protein